jgi:hypothetical protein
VTARAALALLVAISGVAAWAGPDPLPAAPPVGGILWSVIVPALLLAVAVGATVLLYRHFAGREE